MTLILLTGFIAGAITTLTITSRHVRDLEARHFEETTAAVDAVRERFGMQLLLSDLRAHELAEQLDNALPTLKAPAVDIAWEA